MTRTLVTGGTGFVGRFIVEDLLAAGHDIIVHGRTAPAGGFFSRPVRFIRGSLEPDTIDASIFAGVDNLVHAAFDHLPGKYRGGEGGDPDGFLRRNRDGSAALFEAAREAGVRRAVFLSSRAVYGPKPTGAVLTEETRTTPDTLYGEMKLAAERALFASVGADLAAVALRITGVYGDAGTGRPHKWADLFADYLSGKPVASRAGTEVHGADVAGAVRIALGAGAPQILNVSDLMVDRRDLLAIVKAATGSPRPLPDRADASAVNAMDCSRLQNLGWTPGGRPLLERTVRALVG